MCKQAANLTLEKDLGPKRYTDNVCQNMPIRKSISKMTQKARKVLKNRFTTAHYLAKNKKLFADYPGFVDLQELNGLEVKKGYQTDRAAVIFIVYII